MKTKQQQQKKKKEEEKKLRMTPKFLAQITERMELP